MHIYRAVRDANGDIAHNPDGSVQVEGQAPDGSGTPIDIGPSTTTEQWERPVDCQSFDAEGNRVSYPFMADYALFTAGLPIASPPHHDCVEAIGGGMKIGEIADGPDATDWGAKLNGNWGFGDQYIDPNLPAGDGPGQLDDPANLEPLAEGDYVVKVDVPQGANGKPIYKVTAEENINVFAGDSMQQPQPNILKNGCAGANHVVDVAGILPDGPDAVVEPDVRRAGRVAVRGPAAAALRRQADPPRERPLRRSRLRAVHGHAAADDPLRPDHRRPQHGRRQGGDLLRRQGARQADADLLVRLVGSPDPAERHGRERLLRGDAALDEPDQLPEPGGRRPRLVHPGRQRPVDGRPDACPTRASRT